MSVLTAVLDTRLCTREACSIDLYPIGHRGGIGTIRARRHPIDGSGKSSIGLAGR